METAADRAVAVVKKQWEQEHHDAAEMIKLMYPKALQDLMAKLTFALEIALIERDRYLELLDKHRVSCARGESWRYWG